MNGLYRSLEKVVVCALAAVVCGPLASTAAVDPPPMVLATNDVFALSVEGVDDLHLAYAGERPPVVVVSNRTGRIVHLSGSVALSPIVRSGFEERVDCRLEPGGVFRLPLRRPMQKAAWHVTAGLSSDGGKLVAETRFAVVRRRKPTPKQPLGTFRMGLNDHPDRFSSADQERCRRALVQCGAKLIRAEIATQFWCCEPKEGVFEWDKAEQYISAYERIGVAIDAFIADVPGWAMKDEYRGLPSSVRGIWARPARPGVYRDYCQRLAERFGTRIDWYEVGNEWDLIPPQVLSDEDALRMQREAYEGVKAGCPEAKVIPNGWAGFLPYGLGGWMRNLQEKMMVELRDCYDAHAVHEHGPYRDYRHRLVNFLKWRKSKGLGAKPWFSNETALTSATAGEEKAAWAVWQKILCAWTHGSADYVWYSLRGTGAEAGDAEEGYGIMSGDFHPRATYAAFAGLTSCLDGMEPVGVLHEGPHRDVYAFRSRADGVRRRVITGWDLNAKSPVCVRIRTDACRAWQADLFDNRTELPLNGGEVVFAFGQEPVALVLEEATRAEPEATDLTRGESAAVEEVKLCDGDKRYFNLDNYDKVFEIYKADPENVNRVWLGWWDCVAWVTLTRKADRLEIKASVNDEALTAGDAVVLYVDGDETGRITNRKVREKGAEYSGEVALPPDGAQVELRVLDDDGRGLDGWVTTGPFVFKQR